MNQLQSWSRSMVGAPQGKPWLQPPAALLLLALGRFRPDAALVLAVLLFGLVLVLEFDVGGDM